MPHSFSTLQLLQVIQDLGPGPILRPDEFAPYDTALVNNVRLRNQHRAVKRIDPLVRVAHREQIYLVLDQELPVHRIILVGTYPHHLEAGHLLLQRQQAGKLLHTRRAPGGPKIQHHHLAP